MAGMWGWLRSNLGSLGLALLLGLTIWIIVNQEQNPVQEDDVQPGVKINVTGLQPGLVITNSIPTTARVRLRAPHSTWSALTTDQISATADLSGLGPGSHQVPVNVTINAQAFLVSTNPAMLQVDIEEERTREMPVQAHLDGQLAVGYSASTPDILPRRVTVRGPRSAVELVSEVRATVPVDGLRETFKGKLSLVVLDARGNTITNVTVEPDTAEVSVPVTQDAGYRDIAIIARTVGTPDPGYYVTGIKVIPDLITVRGDPEIIKAMQAYAETTPVSLDGLTGSVVKDVTLDLPPGITPINAQNIQMFISIQALQGSRKVNVPVQVIGLAANQKVTLSPTAVDVILSGPLPVLDQIRIGDDIIVSVDVTGLAPGTYQLEPKVQIFRSEVAAESLFPTVISTVVIESSRLE